MVLKFFIVYFININVCVLFSIVFFCSISQLQNKTKNGSGRYGMGCCQLRSIVLLSYTKVGAGYSRSKLLRLYCLYHIIVNVVYLFLPWQFLNFNPLPQGHWSFRPTCLYCNFFNCSASLT